jgi:hypothetical protein
MIIAQSCYAIHFSNHRSSSRERGGGRLKADKDYDYDVSASSFVYNIIIEVIIVVLGG